MKTEKRGFRKGVSPIVSTVLLIMLVVIIAVIIILWYKGVFKLEHIMKFEKPIQENCKDVSLKTYVSETSFSVTNIGNIPIYKMQLKTTSGGSSEIIKIDEQIPVGGSYMFTQAYTGDEKVIIIPVLLGKDKKGNTKEFPCTDYGIEV